MENMEDVLMELNNFEKKVGPENISPVLEEYLIHIAKTGTTLFPWLKIKPLFKKKLEQVIDGFAPDSDQSEQFPAIPNVDHISFAACREKVFQQLDHFNGIPFTVQRICELLTAPKKHYKRTDKYMRALEKNMLVVSTVDAINKQSLNDDSTIVNGVGESPKPKRQFPVSHPNAEVERGEPEKKMSRLTNGSESSNDEEPPIVSNSQQDDDNMDVEDKSDSENMELSAEETSDDPITKKDETEDSCLNMSSESTEESEEMDSESSSENNITAGLASSVEPAGPCDSAESNKGADQESSSDPTGDITSCSKTLASPSSTSSSVADATETQLNEAKTSGTESSISESTSLLPTSSSDQKESTEAANTSDQRESSESATTCDQSNEENREAQTTQDQSISKTIAAEEQKGPCDSAEKLNDETPIKDDLVQSSATSESLENTDNKATDKPGCEKEGI